MTIDLIKENWIVGIVGTLLIGALGSGLWEIVIKPFLKKTGEICFYIMTLGVKKSRDDVYVEAAKNHKELGGAFVAKHLCLLFASFLLVLGMASILIAKTDISKLEESIFTKESHAINDAEIKTKNEKINKLLWKFKYIGILYIFTSFVMIYNALKMQIVYRITTDFNQILTICRPYISAKEAYTLKSEFSLMRKKSDFEKIINDIQIIISENELMSPYKKQEITTYAIRNKR